MSVSALPEVSIAKKSRAETTLAEKLVAKPRLGLAVFTVLYFIASICFVSRQPFWFDEIIGSYLVEVPSIKQIWPLIAQGVELNPPLQFWIGWLLRHSVGTGEIISRVPSLIGYWVMCLCLYQFVRRRSDARFAFIALLCPLFTFAYAHAAEARGYGFLLGSSAAALLCWQYATDGIRRTLTIPGVALGLAIADSTHYYGLYLAGALGVGELVRTFRGEHVDLPIWIALIGGASPVLFFTPLLKGVVSAANTFWSIAPRLSDLYDSYAGMLGAVSLVLMFFIAVTLWTGRSEISAAHWNRPAILPHEIAACGTLFAMPLVVFLAAATIGKIAFYVRYVTPGVIGFSTLFPLFAYRITGNSERFRKFAISLLIWLCFLPWVAWRIGYAVLLPAPAVIVEKRFQFESDLPIVIDNDLQFLQQFHYASTEKRDKLFMLTDLPSAVRYLGTDTTQRSMAVIQSVKDIHCEKYADFIAKNRRFLVVWFDASSWIIQKLHADGADIRLIKLDKDLGIYAQTRLIFQVELPVVHP